MTATSLRRDEQFMPSARYGGSYSQSDMWYMPRTVPSGLSPEELHRANPILWVRSRMEVEGPLDVERLCRSLLDTFGRYEILRSIVRSAQRQPEIEVLPGWLPEISIEEWSESAMERFFALPLDASMGPPARLAIFSKGPRKHEVCLHQHHLFTDGISLRIFWKDVVAGYLGEAPRPDGPSFREYCGALERWLASEESERSRAYWQKKLEGAKPVLLPFDSPRTEPCNFEGEHVDLNVGADVFSSIRRLCREESVTVFSVLLWALARALDREIEQDDILLTTFHANRAFPGYQRVVGPLLAGLLLRCRIDRGKSIGEQVVEVNRVVREAIEHGSVPILHLHERAGLTLPPRNVSLVYQTFVPAFATEVGPLTVRPLEPVGFAKGHAAFELELVLWREGAGLSGLAAYSTQVFRRATVARILARFYCNLSALASLRRPVVSSLAAGHEERQFASAIG